MQKYENLVDLEKRSKTWKNEYLVAIVAVDPAENEPLKVWGWLGSQSLNFKKKIETLLAAQLLYLY